MRENNHLKNNGIIMDVRRIFFSGGPWFNGFFHGSQKDFSRGRTKMV